MEAYSDADGYYSLALAPNTTYVLRYSKAGYIDINRTVHTEDGTNRGVLSVLPMTSSSTILGASTGTSTSSGSTTTPDTRSGDPNAGSGTLQSGYSVQVAAHFNRQTVDLGPFRSLESYGTVYSRMEGNALKVRVGVFQTREEAMQVMRSIREEGYTKAFLVTEQLSGDLAVRQPDAVSATPSAGFGNAGTGGYYKVRLASYKNPKWFDADKVQDLGAVERKKSGPWTIMLLTGFNTLGEAQSASDAAISRGFKGAHVVVEENGALKKVEF